MWQYPVRDQKTSTENVKFLQKHNVRYEHIQKYLAYKTEISLFVLYL